ncbi:Holliday junction branch migration protein RuvA [Clostridium sp. UBA4548]|uniref:Holliday junction branch migration protein RuvA n=1 Tax=Clostridium sp. UBA4548 TaxID=1946361 RepID=UPI0025C6F503|nr:Holliday junction branch migration protein RuvA [Clostridium sp. UBA4548]
MYEYIKGTFIGLAKDYIVVENMGIGYKVFTSGSTISSLPSVGADITLYLQQVVREDFIGLYGFLTKDEIGMFNLLLTINGVGAKATLSLMSICNVTNLQYAILSGDEKTLTKAPGIGKKTAQRIILELKDKIKLEDTVSKNTSISAVESNEERISEVFGALIALGYSEKEAEKALSNVDKSKSIEDMIKGCLQVLMN